MTTLFKTGEIFQFKGGALYKVLGRETATQGPWKGRDVVMLQALYAEGVKDSLDVLPEPILLPFDDLLYQMGLGPEPEDVKKKAEELLA